MPSWRLKVLRIWFLVFGLLVVFRLFYWQVLVGEKLQALAETQHLSRQEIPAQRGEILAEDRFPLATNKQVYLVFADLKRIQQVPAEIASSIASILRPEEVSAEEELRERLARSDLIWVPLARKIDRQKKEMIEKLRIEGIGFEEEEKRFYPEGSMSAHLLGFVGQDAAGQDMGYFGLEGYYDRSLSGRSGLLRQEKDASGKPILIGEIFLEGEVAGRDLVLHLNRGLQFMLEEKLKEGMERYQAKEGLAIIMEPKTGAILAMASFPNFDPGNYAQTEKNLFSNPVISQTFEPGSIFKPVVMASAINEGAIKPEDRCSKCTGPRQIGEYIIRTWDDQYHPDSTMTEILEHSDNVGMVYVSEKLGDHKLIEYLGKFGFDRQTGIDLEGEAVAPIRSESDWVPIDVATVAFGQGVAVTPIQMVRAIAVIANGGELVEPHVVAKIKTAEKEIEIKPKKQGRVITQTTAKIMTEMMVGSVERGGKWERPKGYRIAGKTGTAQIPIAGHYDQEKTIVSFVGFAPASNAADPSDGSPADDPRFVMLVTLREPALIWGSRTVAPLWFEIAKEIFYLLGIPPNF